MIITIKLCVFDLDGTLINSLGDLALAMNYSLKKNGLAPYDVDKYRYFVGDGVPMLVKRALAGNYNEELWTQALADFNDYYGAHNDDLTRPYEGAGKLFSELTRRGVKYAVLSNKPDNFVRVLVAKMFPDAHFAKVMGKLDRFPKKPDPASLNFIIDEQGVEKDETLYIGDSNVDIFTGHGAEVKTVGALWGFRTKEELCKAGADHIAQSPLDVLDFI